MIESEIVAPGSIKSVLSGKHYNHSMRAHKIIYEAMQRLRLEAFEKSLPTNEKAVLESTKLNMMQQFSETDAFWDMSNGDDVIEMIQNYEQFVKKRREEDPSFSFSSKYIEMMQLLLLFIRATRTMDWPLHLSSLKAMIHGFLPQIVLTILVMH